MHAKINHLERPTCRLQDKNPNNKQKAEEQFKVISEAYDVSFGAMCRAVLSRFIL